MNKLNIAEVKAYICSIVKVRTVVRPRTQVTNIMGENKPMSTTRVTTRTGATANIYREHERGW